MKRIVLLPLLLLAACSGGDKDPEAPAATDGASPAVSEDAAAASSDSADAAGAAGRTSRYTSLKDCKVVDDGGGEDWSVSRCEGLGGFTVVINYGDARDDLELQYPQRQPVALGLPYLAGGGFNTLGDTVEWRGSGAGTAFAPTALIVRNSTVQNPERPDRPTALLAVIDLKQECVVAQVRPGPGQNEQARAIADGPVRKCLPLEGVVP